MVTDAAPDVAPASDTSRDQRRRSAALTVALVVVALGGALSRVPVGGAAPTSCAQPAVREGVLVCDGNGDAPGAKAWLVGQKLDVNTASARELELIPDVGPSLAHAIVEERAKRGRFGTFEELDDVDGIGPKTLDKLRDYITVP